MSRPKRGKISIQTAVLLGVLCLVAVAGFYDYLLARPGVAEAEAAVAKLTAEVAGSSAKKVLTDQDIHDALHRKPSRVFNEGPYVVEQYNWMSGLLVTRHKYYALYLPVSNDRKIFQTHFAYALPDDVGDVEVTTDLGEDSGETGPAIVGQDEPRGKRRPSRRKQADETAASEDANLEKPATEQAATEQAATEQAATEQAATEQAATEQAATEETAMEQTESTPESDKPATEKPAVEKPAVEKPAVEKPAADSSEAKESAG